LITITKITAPDDPQVCVISDLAHEIWHQHFTPIIGRQQVEYMLKRFQCEEAIIRQISSEGYIYYLAFDGDTPIGYAGIVPNLAECAIFLSKLYMRESCRGNGVARMLLNTILADYSDNAYKSMYLTCNKHNENTIAVYQHMGFKITDSVVKSIGNGMVMDDYIMTLVL